MKKITIDLTSSESGAKVDLWAGRIFTFIFGIPFAAMGLFVIWKMVAKFQQGKTREALPGCLFGLVFAAVGFGMMYAAITAASRKKAAAEKWQAQTDGGKKPWRARPDWARGETKSNAKSQIVLIWIMALAFSGFGFPILFFVIPQELHHGNQLALIALMFPLVGTGLLITAIYQSLRWMKYGAVIFKMKSVPGIIGGVLTGNIRIPAHFQPQSGLSLRLCCVHRIVTGSGKSRSVSEHIFWEDEKHLGGNLPRTGLDEYDVPVFFKIPAGSRETDSRQSDDQIIWRLTAVSKQAGIDFRADFDVPVFKITGEVMGDMADPTAALQVPTEEIVRNEHSRIKVNEVAGGREFFFPAARNIGMVLYVTGMFIILTGFTLAAFFLFKSLLFEIIFGVVDILMFFSCLSLWLKSSRVTINATSVRVTNHWLFIGPTHTIDAGDIARFETKAGMTTGSRVYCNLQIITRAGKKSTIANGVPNRLEADWLVKEMSRSLGRSE